jgi:hypothetical protein
VHTLPSPLTALFPGGGAFILPTAQPQTPHVLLTKKAICILYGEISNLDELQESYNRNYGPDGSFSISEGSRQELEQPSFDARADQGTLAAELLLHMYLRTKTNDLLIMLSELQGHYSFVIYDSARRRAYAARDPSGEHPLYYSTDSDGAVSYTNQKAIVPGAERKQDWQELLPGHFLSGKNPKMQQFALTRDELHARTSMDFEGLEEFAVKPVPVLSPRSSLRHKEVSSLADSGELDQIFIADDF